MPIIGTVKAWRIIRKRDVLYLGRRQQEEEESRRQVIPIKAELESM